MDELFSIQDIDIEFSRKNIIEKLNYHINNTKVGYICTINSNLISEAFYNAEYKKILQKSIINICDGSVLAKGIGWVYNKKLRPWPGPDFFINIIEGENVKNIFLGSNKETLESIKKNLIKKNINIDNAKFYYLPYCSVENFDYNAISYIINQEKPGIIWVSLGAPKQEIFASYLVKYLNQGVIICVGAAFDFYGKSNGNSRAPFIIRKMSLEWLWRIIQAPKKTIKRLIREIVIVPRILFSEKMLEIKKYK